MAADSEMQNCSLIGFDGSLTVRRRRLRINMENTQLDDWGARRWCAWAEDALPVFVSQHGIARQQDGYIRATQVNFANNYIGDDGIVAVLRLLHDHRIAIDVLKLFNNRLGRADAESS